MWADVYEAAGITAARATRPPSLFELFQVDLDNYERNKAMLVKHFKVSLAHDTGLEAIDYGEYERLVDHWKALAKEDEEEEAKKRGGGETWDQKRVERESQRMMKNAKVPNYKPPQLGKLPNFKMPK